MKKFMFFDGYQLQLEVEKPIGWYEDAIKEWAEFDARQVVLRGESRGKWARYRLDILAELQNPIFFKDLSLAPKLYDKYVELLNAKIQKLNGGKNSYGSVPVFKYSKAARQADRKIVVR